VLAERQPSHTGVASSHSPPSHRRERPGHQGYPRKKDGARSPRGNPPTGVWHSATLQPHIGGRPVRSDHQLNCVTRLGVAGKEDQPSELILENRNRLADTGSTKSGSVAILAPLVRETLLWHFRTSGRPRRQQSGNSGKRFPMERSPQLSERSRVLDRRLQSMRLARRPQLPQTYEAHYGCSAPAPVLVRRLAQYHRGWRL
jgi:hypothetical protein